MKCLNLENDRTIKRLIKQITPKEYELMVKHGDKHLSNGKDSSHFFPLKMDLVKYEAFCEMVKTGKPAIQYEDTLETVKILEAARTSVNENCHIPMSEI